MPKRKRGADGDHTATKQTYIQKELYERKTAIFRAMKIAKGFERQKLARRQKEAETSGNTADKERIHAETEALRELDLHIAAERYMYKTLLRIKSIANAPNLPKEVVIESGDTPPQALANVTARLCNNKLVKAAMDETIAGLQTKLKPAPTKAGPELVVERKKEDRTDSPLDQEDVNPRVGSDGEIESQDEWVGFDGQEGNEEALVETPYKGFDVDMDSDDYAAFDSRIADSDSESSQGDDESDLDSESSFPLHKPGTVTKPPLILDAQIRQPKTKEKTTSITEDAKPKAKPSSTSTAFLPSLTMGGYWSGSESEPEDLDAEDVAPVRKNRRGQRARQAIWEAKYGSGAKHLDATKQSTSSKNRDAGWDLKRGASSKADLPLWKRKKMGITNANSKAPLGVGGSNAIPVRNVRTFGGESSGAKAREAKRREDAPLHPSWEAKKKMKDAGMPAFSGKKVTFD